MKKVIFGYDDDEDDAELQAARARHGIVVDEKKGDREKGEDEEPYDAWDDIRNFRTNFVFGRWATRKFRIIGEDKVKKELAELEKKREEEAKEKEEKGEGE